MSGDDAVPINRYDVIALVLVLLGFVIYSSFDDVIYHHHEKVMPIQFAAGSMMYLRERSNSDPGLYTPIKIRTPKRRGSIDEQLNRTPSITRPMAIVGAGGRATRPVDFRVMAARGSYDSKTLKTLAAKVPREEEIENTVSV